MTAKDKYLVAETCYKNLQQNRTKQQYQHNWQVCIRKFEAVHRHDPSGPWAAAGLYMSGVIYQELYKHSGRKADELEALDIFKRVIKGYPNSRYRQRAAAAIRSIAGDFRRSNTRESSKPEPVQKPAIAEKTDTLPTAPAGNTRITGLRHWSNPNYTRIVIDADQEAAFTDRLLKEDPSINKPKRLYVDLEKSVLGEETKKTIPINDELLIDARAAQHSPDQVRVVIDIKSFTTYKIFSLKNPFRIVLDVWGETEKKSTTPLTQETKPKDPTDSALARQLALGVRRIVIDPGHGGRDFGAPGYLNGVHEKDIVLDISKRLARKIREKLNCEVVLSRTRDEYLTLEERTAFANTQNADLFISIHTNSTRDRRAFGIETYFLNLATDENAILVAARENATSAKNISDLQTILNDLMQHSKINESSRLAAQVQTELYQHMKNNHSRIKNLGVKQAPFYVLLGAQMPSILIETSFISNARECKRLISQKYQADLCDAITGGIRNYIREINPVALSVSGQ